MEETISRKWIWIDTILTGARTLFFLAGLVFLLNDERLFDKDMTLCILLFVANYLLPHLFWRPGYTHRICYPLVEGGLSTVFYLYLVGWADIDTTTTVVPLLTMGYIALPKARYWIVPWMAVAAPAAAEFMAEQPHYIDILQKMLGMVLVYAVGYSFNRAFEAQSKMNRLLEENQRQYQMIEEQNRALVQYAQQVEKLTLLEERNRMARELHDTVGHTFTSVIMGLDAVSYLIDPAPEKAMDKVEVLRKVMRNGLEEVRRNIHQIAAGDEDLMLSVQLVRLANEFALHTGTRVRLQTEGEEYEVPGQVKLTLIRCLQESLTNAKRHGQAMDVCGTLRFDPDGEVRLTIRDDGIGAQEIRPGFGLTAMRERLQALNGTLTATSETGKGAEITCTVPVRRNA